MNVCVVVLCVGSCSNRWRSRSPGGGAVPGYDIYDTDLSAVINAFGWSGRLSVCFFCSVCLLPIRFVTRLGGGTRGGEDEWGKEERKHCPGARKAEEGGGAKDAGAKHRDC